VDSRRKVIYAGHFHGYFIGFYEEDSCTGKRSVVALVETERGDVVQCQPHTIHFRDWPSGQSK